MFFPCILGRINHTVDDPSIHPSIHRITTVSPFLFFLPLSPYSSHVPPRFWSRDPSDLFRLICNVGAELNKCSVRKLGEGRKTAVISGSAGLSYGFPRVNLDNIFLRGMKRGMSACIPMACLLFIRSRCRDDITINQDLIPHDMCTHGIGVTWLRKDKHSLIWCI